MKQYQIIKRSPIFIGISVAILVIGLIFFVYRWFAFGLDKTLNLTVDFTGGTIMTVDLKQNFNESEVRSIVENLGLTDVQVQKSSENNKSDQTIAIIRFRQEKAKGLSNNQGELREKLSEGLKAKYPNISTNPENNRIESIGVTVSRELIQNALVSVLLACAAILVYVSWRFDTAVKGAKKARWINTLFLSVALLAFYFFQSNFWVIAISTLIAIVAILTVSIRSKMYSGLSAVLALVHDVLIILVAMVILQIPLGNPFVAVALTIIGFSINDTIIIFDRIRENETKYNIKIMSRKDVANLSINEMLGRSIKTNVTALITAIAIYVLGVESIKEFALPMIIGMIAGSYSTIFIASPVWSFWQDADQKKTAKLQGKVA